MSGDGKRGFTLPRPSSTLLVPSGAFAFFRLSFLKILLGFCGGAVAILEPKIYLISRRLFSDAFCEALTKFNKPFESAESHEACERSQLLWAIRLEPQSCWQ
jgi:hypothetical protein